MGEELFRERTFVLPDGMTTEMLRLAIAAIEDWEIADDRLALDLALELFQIFHTQEPPREQ